MTIPFKEETFRLADSFSNRARAAGAVDTPRFDRDRSFGDNTDGGGLVRDITQNLGVRLARKRVLLGAGGAVHAAFAALLEAGLLPALQ